MSDVVTITEPGIYDAETITGYVVISPRCPPGDVVFLRGSIPGPDVPSTERVLGLVTNLNPAVHVYLDNTDLVPTCPRTDGAGMAGAYGVNLHLYGVRTRHVTDGLDDLGGCETDACVMTDFAWTYPDGVHKDGRHCDGIQIAGGMGHWHRRNVIVATIDPTVSVTSDPAGHRIPELANSAVMIGQSARLAPLTGVDISGNWLGGGAYSVQVDGKQDLTLGRIGGNVDLGGSLYGFACIPAPGAKRGVTITCDTDGNTLADGTPALIVTAKGTVLRPMPAAS